MKKFQDINQSPSAKRKIKSLAKNSNIDVEFVTLLANVSWDYDIDPNWREPFGWVQKEQCKSNKGQETFAKIAEILKVPTSFSLTNEFLIDSILKSYTNFDNEILFQNFLYSGKTKNYAYLSEYSTYHYLNNLTIGHLNILDFKKEYSIEKVVEMLFRKVFKGGAVNRNELIYCYSDLCLKLPYLESSKNKVLDWSKQVITQINNLPKKSTLSDLINCTKPEVKGDKYFRQQILQGLSYSGILKVKDIKIKEIFIPKYRNELSSHFYSNEWTFPLKFWNDTITANKYK